MAMLLLRYQSDDASCIPAPQYDVSTDGMQCGQARICSKASHATWVFHT